MIEQREREQVVCGFPDCGCTPVARCWVTLRGMSDLEMDEINRQIRTGGPHLGGAGMNTGEPPSGQVECSCPPDRDAVMTVLRGGEKLHAPPCPLAATPAPPSGQVGCLCCKKRERRLAWGQDWAKDSWHHEHSCPLAATPAPKE
ncbi:MAG: hypothetical protein NUW01_00115 [Gemmatimonadaceae bacterium]|nr:hypothetical protein [Gemmatimonadaceae bacterium]